MDNLNSFDVEGNGIKYYYNDGEEDIPKLSSRNTFTEGQPISTIIDKYISANKKSSRKEIAFMPIDIYETNLNKRYCLRIFGILMDGRKVEVNITDIDLFFDVKVPNGVNHLEFELHINTIVNNNVNYRIETIEAYPLQYSKEKIQYKRIYTDNTYDRSRLIAIIKDQMKLDTYSNDASRYYRKAAREHQLSLSNWVMLYNYDVVSTSYSPLCEYVFNIKKDDYRILDNEKLKSDSRIVRDKTLVMAWDIETYSTRNSGELPDASYKEDNAFMICVSLHWLHDYEALEKICIVDKDTEPDPRWITIVCGSYVNIIKAFAICWNRYKPDIFIGFNDARYDWPFIMKKSIEFDILPWMWKKMSAVRNDNLDTTESIQKYYYPTRARSIKITAEDTILFHCPIIPGTVCMDAALCFMKLYPRSETTKFTSLKFYLNDNNLPTKVDLPISDLWRYYIGGDLTNMRKIAYYCIVDTVSVQNLFVKRSIVSDYREVSTLAYISLSDTHYYAGGVRVCNLLGSHAWKANILVNMQPKWSDKTEKYPGAYVIDPDKGVTPNVERLKKLKSIEDENEAIEQFTADRPVSCLDFASLYPSIIMAYNLSPEKIILNEQDKIECEKNGYKLHKIEFQLNDKMIQAWSISHNNKEENIGLFPKILISLFNKRKEMKKKLKEYSDKIEIYDYISSSAIELKSEVTTKIKDIVYKRISDEIDELRQDIKYIPPGSTIEEEQVIRNKRIIELDNQLKIIQSVNIKTFNKDYSDLRFERNCIDKKQNALKIYMNTFYGETGNHLSPFFLLELAGGVTSAGQYNIKKVQQYVKDKGYYVKYGDSIMPYTPITVKINDYITVTTIKVLSDYINWMSYPEFKMFDSNRTNKEYGVIDNIYIWSASGWTRIKKFIRHNTIKRIYRVITYSGIVDVTEDHSLLTSNYKLLKPSCCNSDTELLHSTPIIDYHNRENFITNKEAFVYGVFVGCGFIHGNLWIIANIDYNLLLRCKHIIEKLYINIQSVDDSKPVCNSIIIKKHNNLYYLYVYDNIGNLILNYSKLISTKGIRIVPNNVINSKEIVVSHFLLGLKLSIQNGFVFYRLNELLNVVFNKHDVIRSSDINLETYITSEYIVDTLYCYHQITAQMYIILLQSLGYEIMINMYKSIYIIHYSKDSQYVNQSSDLQYVRNIELLHSKYKGYVYDIETEDGTFHAGIGDLIVKNTDSLYITCPNGYFKECDIKYRNNEYTKEQFFTAMVKITLRVIALFQQEINTYLENDNGTKYLKMENEGCNYPCIFLGKKKYFAIQHITDVNFKPKKLYIKGIEIIKQGKSGIEKEIGNDIMYKLVSLDNEDSIMEVVKKILKEAINEDKWKFEDFVLSKKWKPTKKNVSVQTFMKRMTIRHELEKKENEHLISQGKEPNPLKYQPLDPGERFSYVLVKKHILYDLKGKKVTMRVGDNMEYDYIAKEQNMEIDLSYYLINYVISTCARFISSDNLFAPPTNNPLTAKKEDEYRVTKAKKVLEKYLKSFIGLSKDEMQIYGYECKQLFKTAVQVSLRNTPVIYKNFIQGPLVSMAFVDEKTNIVNIIIEHAKKQAIVVYNKYCLTLCETLCVRHGINYKNGSDINSNSCENLYYYIDIYKPLSKAPTEFMISQKLSSLLPHIHDLCIEYESNIEYIINKLQSSENDIIDVEIEYNVLSSFNNIWHEVVGILLNKLQIDKYYNYINNLKYKRLGMSQKPSKQSISSDIANFINNSI